VLIIREQADAAILDGEQIDATRTDPVPIRTHLAPHAQARDATIRKNIRSSIVQRASGLRGSASSLASTDACGGKLPVK
jgi:hypothetical protein